MRPNLIALIGILIKSGCKYNIEIDVSNFFKHFKTHSYPAFQHQEKQVAVAAGRFHLTHFLHLCILLLLLLQGNIVLVAIAVITAVLFIIYD
jgi:hypothetical protein